MGRGSGELVPGCFVSADWRITVHFCQCRDGNSENSAVVIVFLGCVEVVCIEDVSLASQHQVKLKIHTPHHGVGG